MSKVQRLLALTLAFVVMMSAGVAFADHTATSEGVVGGFEIDGDFDFPPPGTPLAGATRDWENVGGVTRVVDPPDPLASGKDTIFTNGSKEEQPDGWVFANQKPPGKADITRAYFASQETQTASLIWLAFERVDGSGKGDVHANFELNQKNTTIVNSKGTTIPERSDEDLLVVYDYPGGSGLVIIEVREWNGAPDNPATPQNEEALFGTWDPANPPPYAPGDINAGIITRPNAAPFGGGSVGAKRFGEVGLDLKQIFGSGFSFCPGGFLQFSVKSRSSGESFNSALKDFVGPAGVTTCPQPVSTPSKGVRNFTTSPTAAFATTATASPGDTLQYQLVYDNQGNAAATGVVVTDTLEPKQTFVSGSCVAPTGTTCSFSGGTLTWTIGTVAAGQTLAATFKVTLDATFPAGTTQVTNKTTADSDQEPPKDSNTVTTNVGAAPVSTPSKGVRNFTTSPTAAFATTATASPGDTLEYQLVYANQGNAAATGVVVTDTLEPKQTFVSGSCVAPTGTTCSFSGGTLTWTIGTVAAGQTLAATFKVTLDATFPAGTTQVTNKTTADSDQETPRDSNTVTTTVAATPVSTPSKGVRNFTTSPTAAFATTATASPGDTLEYQLVYTNQGNAAATGVVVTDTLEPKQTFVPGSCVVPTGTTCSTSGGTLTWTIGTVAAGQTLSGTFKVTLDATFPAGTTQVTNKASADSDQETPRDSNTVTTTVVAAPDSGLVKSVKNLTTPDAGYGGSTSAQPGDTISYRLIYTNAGNAPASNVVVTDTLELKQTYVNNSCSGPAGVTCSYDTATRTVTFNLGTQAPDGPVTLTFEVTLDATFPAGQTTIKNHGTTDSTEEAAEDSNETTVTLNGQPNLGLLKSASVTTVLVGGTITYTLKYFNNSKFDATNVTITEPLPQGTDYSGCSDNCGGAPLGPFTWTIASVPGNTTAANPAGQVTLTVTVRSDAPCRICNIATISSADQNSGTPVNSNQVCVDLRSTGVTSQDSEAYGLFANIPALGPDLNPLDPPTPTTEDDDPNDTLVTVPADPIATAKLVSVSKGEAADTTNGTHAQATATTGDVKVLNLGTVANPDWLVTATAIQAVSSSDASGTTAGSSGAGSVLLGVTVGGDSLGTVSEPVTKVIVIPGVGTATVELLEMNGAGVMDPSSSQPASGTWHTGLEVNGIHVTITDSLGNIVREIIVAHAASSATFPDTRGCGAQSPHVSGEAYSLQVNADEEIIDPDNQLLFGEVGRVVLPSTGSEGVDSTASHVGPLSVDGGNNTLAESNTAFNHTEGCVEGDCPDGTEAFALTTSEIQQLRLLDRDPNPAVNDFLIAADKIQAHAKSEIDADGASSEGGTTIANLTIDGIEICSAIGLDAIPIGGGLNGCTPAPNTVLLGIPNAVIVLNEQIKESGTNASSMTVNAIHIYIVGRDNPFRLPAGSDVIVSHVHSDVVGAGSSGVTTTENPGGQTIIELPLVQPAPAPAAAAIRPVPAAPAPKAPVVPDEPEAAPESQPATEPESSSWVTESVTGPLEL